MKPKRKITDLKENECIHIRNERERQFLIDNFPQRRLIEVSKIPLYFLPTSDGYHTSGELFRDKTAVRCSDFLPRKRKNSKLWKEIKRLDGRVRELEPNCRYVSIPIEQLKPANEPEFTLPEKWCVLNTEENRDEISNYFGKEYRLGFFIHEPPRDIFRDYNVVSEGYTEITTEQFVKYVLGQGNETSQPKEIDFSVPGQTLTTKQGKLVLTSGKHDRNDFSGMCLKTHSCHEKGYYSDAWCKSSFTLYPEPIILKNE